LETKAQVFWLDFKNNFLKQREDVGLCRHWLEPVVASKIEEKNVGVHLTLKTPSSLHKKWLQKHMVAEICKQLKRLYTGVCQVHLEVASTPLLPKLPSAPKDSKIRQAVSLFNPNYLFENFVVGQSNQLAYSASLSISQKKPCLDFNPLFIYGPSGLGKTHLLNAIGQQILEKHPDTKVLYLSAERFLNEYITALQTKQMDAFRKKFRKNCDILLMDDVQIIAKGKAVQEEFFHCFNELYNQKSQVVVCCDQNPGSIPLLEERVKNRLEGGLMVDISYPNKETRMAILKNKTEQKNLSLSFESLEKIAKSCRHSIREMEGVLNKIKIMTELHSGVLSLKEIEKILSHLKRELTVEEIQKKTAKAFQLSIEDLLSPSRKKHIVQGRQVAMFLIRNYLKKSLSDIGLIFNKKDHTTVLSSIKKVERLKVEDPVFKGLLEALQEEINLTH